MIGAFLAGASQLFNIASQRMTNDANIANQNALWQKQVDYQNWLNSNSALIKKNSLKNAGLNVNWSDGAGQNLQMPSPSMSQQYAPQIDAGALGQLVNQTQLNDAQIRQYDAGTAKAQAETRHQELENQILEDKVLAGKNSGTSIGEMEFISQNYDNLIKKADLDSKNIALQVQELQAKLDSEVIRKQIDNPKTVAAIADMPYRLQQKLIEDTNSVIQSINESKQRVKESQQNVSESKQRVKESMKRIEMLDSDIKVNQSQISLNKANQLFINVKRKIEEDTNVSKYIQKLVDDGAAASFDDFLKAFLMVLASRFS